MQWMYYYKSKRILKIESNGTAVLKQATNLLPDCTCNGTFRIWQFHQHLHLHWHLHWHPPAHLHLVHWHSAPAPALRHLHWHLHWHCHHCTCTGTSTLAPALRHLHWHLHLHLHSALHLHWTPALAPSAPTHLHLHWHSALAPALALHLHQTCTRIP
jgi:hypothetical protein